MEVTLKQTYDAIFGEIYAICGKIFNAIPVDVMMSGYTPTPTAILQGIFTAITGAHVIEK